MKKDAYYFSHDANARNDLKSIKLRQSLGMEGYGVFWAIIEILRETDGHKLKKSDIRTISFDLKVSEEIIASVINDFDLFKISGDVFWSKRLTQSMLQYKATRQSLSDAGRKGNAIRWGSGGDANVIALKERKGNKRKEGFSPSGGGKYKKPIAAQLDKDGLDHNGNPGRSFDGMVM